MATGNRNRALPAALAVLCIGVVTTLAAWHSARTAAEASARQRFEKRAADVAFRIRHGFAGYESVLRSGAALLAVERDVSQQAWRNFVAVVDMERRYPGMVALGYARYLSTAELPELERRVRGYDAVHYQVWPKAPGPVHVPVVFSEPYEVAAKAHGFDMFTEPVRRAALCAARDTGMPALTGRLTLVYDQPDAGNVGFLVYVPVYRIGAAHGSVERRRRAIDGYAFGAFRVREALQPLLAEFPEILDVAVYDGAQPADADLMFDTRLRPFGGPDLTEPVYSTDLPIELAGQIWTLRFRSRPAFEQQVDSSLPVLVLASGVVVTLLLARLAFAIGRTRDQALAIAAGMTAELRATTAELQAIYDSSPLGVYRTDADGLVLSINRRGEEICGLPAHQLLGATWIGAIHAADRPGVEAAWARTSGGEGRYENELRLQRGDGGWVWLSVKSAPLFRLGKLDGHVGTIEDVTVRHEAVAELERNRAFLTELIDASPNPIFVKDVEHRWVLVNQAFCALVDRPREALLRQDDSLVYDADTVRVRFAEDDQVLGSGEPLLVERPQRAADGSTRWLLKSKSRIRLPDESFGVVGLMTDVTALKHVQAQAQSARGLLDGVLAAMPMVVSLKDSQYRFLLINDAARESHGLPPAAFIGKDDYDLFPREQADRIRAQDEAARVGDTVLAYEEEFTTLTGEKRWVVKRKRGVNLPDGTRGVVTALYDFTAVKQAQNAVRESEARFRENLQALVEERTCELTLAMEAATRANLAKSEFLANMSHELRTPMHAILSFARLGGERAGSAPADKLQQYFARVEQSGERLLTLLDDLLDLSKLEAGKMRYDMTDADVAALMRGAAEEYAELAGSRGVSLEIEAAAGLRAWCDPARIGQVMRNLMSNAIKFSPRGGRIALVLEEALHAGGAAVAVSVSDQGAGIPEGELEQVFDKFVQSSKTRSGAGGTGLGLSICRQIVEDHGGRIWAGSNRPCGARIVFLLPCSAPASQADLQEVA